MQKWFSHFSKWFANVSGHPIVFFLAISVIAVWAVTGPIFKFSDTWQLIINTGTTIVTFLMVFLIQNTQNRDAAAIQLKLDELIRALQGAHTNLMDAEDRTMDELEELRAKYLSEAGKGSDGVDESGKTQEGVDQKRQRSGTSKKRLVQSGARKSRPPAKKKVRKRAS